MRTFRRTILDNLLKKNRDYFHGIVLDIGGRDRGKFKKPKNQTKEWIFADINPENKPDIMLDVMDMKNISDSSIDVINATELFEHVADPGKGLRECYRVLRQSGVIIISSPFLFPIHADPHDYQRLTETKWKETLNSTGFIIEKFAIMGKYFTVLNEQILFVLRSLPYGLKYLCYLVKPVLSLINLLDSTKIFNISPFKNYHGGYFIIAKK
jgi:SAM-dependent methyltransferase